ncbi:Na+/H+ antiporter NhaC family protein [Halostella sp. JP-L12]|uniref:Na+/H+ antiporter NhaC family protein n=1 Tax=Halostella TaxID=1843185 RepID=UPI000EF7F87E|nr:MULTISPECIES: Na+/H+ antiporter NhaC family protein [Halostella]NHN46235.1 Na+/H+ antiporter NhaC family protein [Halostella sp. JP-L12]
MASEFGAISLVPPLLAIVLAIATRRAMLSLFLGVWVGGAIVAAAAADTVVEYAAVPFTGVVEAFDWIVSAVGESTFQAKIIIFTFLLGAGIALLWRLGGSLAVAQFARSKVDSHRRVGVVTWLFGMVWFFDDYANTAIVGSAMKDMADNMRMSREKLAYILDSTAAPVATFGISSWVAFQIGLVASAYEEMGIQGETPSAVATFLWSIPFNVYCLLAVLMVGIVVVTQRDFGEMLDAETRARRTGNVTREDANPLQSMKEDLGDPVTDDPRLRTFVFPVLVLVVVVLGGAAYTGWTGFMGSDAVEGTFTFGEALLGQAPMDGGEIALGIAENADFTGALVWGSFGMVATALTLGLIDDHIDLEEGMETVLDGFGIMLHAVSILVLAWSIGSVASALGTGDYVTGIAEGIVTPTLLPIVILFAAAFISFSIGTSWGTMALVTPVAVPLAWSIGNQNPEMVAVAVGAVFSGSIFGDHCSPISDTTILSSTFAGSDHIDHVRTQMYYAVTVISVATLAYLIYGVTGLGPAVFLPVCAVVLIGLVYGLSELDASRKDVPAKPFDGAGADRGTAGDD